MDGSSLLKTKNISDSGGVAARVGFKYQDHAAVQFVIKMLSSNSFIIEVQCETADDIVVVYNYDDELINEYVQVKTTNGNSKWNLTELCAKKPNQSLYSNSLSQNIISNNSLFRIITSRDVDKKLSILKIPLRKRNDRALYTKLAKSIRNKTKEVSPSGNDSEFWVDNAFWQFSESIEALIATNQKNLFKVFEDSGELLNHSTLISIYEKLLSFVDKAACATKLSNPEKKVITKEFITKWWAKELESLKLVNRSNFKPYKDMTDSLLVRFHMLNEDHIMRGVSGLDVGYEMEEWRYSDLVDHIHNWLPEICLKASELSSMNHTNFRIYSDRIRKKVASLRTTRGIEIIADILLHIAIRQCYKSEPIACKVFFTTIDETKCFSNAHIIKTSDGMNRLWLGKAAIIPMEDFVNCSNVITEMIKGHLDKDFLKAEREVILEIKESRHLSENNLDEILNSNSSLDVLLSHLCIPILVTYDSPALKEGWAEDYLKKLTDEVMKNYEFMKPIIPSEFLKIEIQMFLLPLEDCNKFIEMFDRSI